MARTSEVQVATGQGDRFGAWRDDAEEEAGEPHALRRSQVHQALLAVVVRTEQALLNAKESEVARLLTDEVGMTLYSVPSHWHDGEGWVCLFWACPLTCGVGRTLPIRAKPEKPCGVDCRKNKFARFWADWRRRLGYWSGDLDCH